MADGENPRISLEEAGRTRTASLARRRRTADAQIAALGDWRTVLEAALAAEADRQDSARRASERVFSGRLDDIVNRMDTQESLGATREQQLSSTLDNMANTIAALKTLLQSQSTFAGTDGSAHARMDAAAETGAEPDASGSGAGQAGGRRPPVGEGVPGPSGNLSRDAPGVNAEATQHSASIATSGIPGGPGSISH